MSLAPKAIVILGMFRSGTSSVAGVLSRLGIHFGEDAAFFEADEQNQGGYFELKDVMAVNRQALAALNMSYHRVHRIPADWDSRPGMNRVVDAIGVVLEKHFDEKMVWGWKEPMTTCLLPLYATVLAEKRVKPHYVICVRNPLEVVASERKRDPLVGDRAFGLWLHYTLSALLETKNAGRSLIVYDRFLEDPRKYVASAANFAGLTASETEWERACKEVSDRFRHHNGSVTELDQWPEILGQTYRLCLEIDEDPTGFSQGNFDSSIEALWDQYCRLQRIMSSPGLETSKVHLVWERAGQREGVSAVYVPTGSWQTIRAQVRAVPGAVIQADLYQMPAQIWIRKANWIGGDTSQRAQLVQGPTGWLEEVDGLMRATVFGPAPMALRFPANGDTFEVELEFLVESNFDTLTRILLRFRQQMESMRKQPTPWNHPR